MPELKNLFVQGKMNKDLDERLVPQGEYRDALNVDVSYSEGSDVGALQNILGNSQISTNISLTSAECIGSIRDDENAKIYWFITSAAKDIIAEYDGTTVSPIIVDTGSVLNFSTNNYITGVNILDGILYFTDNLNEPKQVDIDYWKTKTSDFDTTSTGLSEDRITVIKKGPLNAPTFNTLASSLRGGNGTIGGAIVKVSRNLSTLAVGDTIVIYDAEYKAADETTSITPNWNVNDVIELKNTFTDDFGLEKEAVARLKYTIDGGSSDNTFEVLTITSDVANASVFYTAILEEEEALFELKFPKFAYRYKYKNGQYSTTSPFSMPAFIPGNYSYTAKEGFNTGMVNTVRQIILEGWLTSTSSTNYEADIEAIEILYKDSVSSNIYIVDEVTKGGQTETGDGTTTEFEVLNANFNGDAPDTESDIEVYVNDVLIANTNYTYPDTNPPLVVQGNKLTFTGNTGNTNELESSGAPKDGLEIRIIVADFASTFEVKDEQIFKAIESNQLLRPFDSVPRKAKSQEIIANRLIYGNYQQNFNFTGTPIFSVDTGTRADSLGQNLSLKSGRKYQIGITFKDEYGRETPVFTDKSGIIKIPYKEADLEQDFRVSTSVTVPSEATHYKYYVKEVSNPYYNLAASNIYEDKETGHLYISFPSSEVNKVSENDVLVFKKDSGDSAYKLGDNKFKVLSKLSSPPNFLANKEKIVYTTDYLKFDQEFGAGNIQTTKQAGRTPVSGHNTILLEKAGRLEDDTSPNRVDDGFVEAITVGSQIRFRRNGTSLTSKIYKVKSIATDPDGEREAEIVFETPFGDDVNVIYDDADGYEAAIEKIETESDLGNPEYEGKFFIKLNADSQLKQRLFAAIDESTLGTVATHSNINMVEDTVGHDIREYFVSNVATPDNTLGAITTISGETLTTSIPSGFHIVFVTENDYGNTRDQYSNDPFGASLSQGNYLRFSGWSTGYQGMTNFRISEVQTELLPGGQRYYAVKFTANMDHLFPTAGRITVDARSYIIDKSTTFTNPPVFEIEPEDGVLDIFYETGDAYAIADIGSTKAVSYANCFSFGNGVESDRIRDDFNAPTLGKGDRVSTTFEDNYQQETLKTGLIFSGIYNSKNGINRLNQFIIAEPITKDLNPEFGSIQKLHARETDLIALCENKTVRILANKDALFNADGNPQLTATNRVLGQAIVPPTFGAYGIGKNPESFASHTYRAYFADKNRRKILRLSLDGITEISAYGIKDYTKDKLTSSTGLIVGSYDEEKDQYNLTFSDDTISFSESVKGWPSRKSFLPESGISLNNVYYTFKGGHLYKHNNTTRNTFYGTKADSEVTLFLNGNPGNVKNFRTLNYQGDTGWLANSITTDKQEGQVASFINKEDIYYNYISGVTETTKADLDLKSLNIQGLGTPTAISGNDATFTDLNSAIQVGDKVYNNTDSGFKTVTAVSGNTITLDSAPTNDFSYFVKDNKFNTSGILGYYMQVTLTNTATTAKELYSIGSEVSLSS